MNQSHVIDSWIAELGLSGRRARRTEERVIGPAGAALEAARSGREAPLASPALATFAQRRPRYQVISSPC
jgi:hypothetical protein